MRRLLLAVMILSLVACGNRDDDFRISRDPVSVRGWIRDVKGAKQGETIEMELARRSALFLSSSVWVENVQTASGGIQENGAFVVLDVPPKSAIIGFNAPGAEAARVTLENVPGTADVLIPDLILESGGAKVLDPKKIVVRVIGSERKATGQIAKVAGYDVQVMQVPITEMMDRRDYPEVPGFRPVATVR